MECSDNATAPHTGVRRGHDRPSMPQARHRSSLLGPAADAALIAAVVLAPLALGAVHRETQLALLGLAAVAALLVTWHGRRRGGSVHLPLLALLPVGLLALTAWQLLPLPRALIALFSPRGHDVLATSLDPLDGFRWHALSLDPPATAVELGKLTIYLLLARIYIEGKEYAKAAKVYEEALARRPDFWIAANDLAALLCGHPGTGKELDRALELAKSAYKIRPDDPIVQDTLGWACYKKGDNAQAVDLLEKAQGKLAGHPEVNYHLGMALVKAGKKEHGKEHLRTSVAAKGEYPWKAEAARTLAGT